jgi:hypothetical protein
MMLFHPDALTVLALASHTTVGFTRIQNGPELCHTMCIILESKPDTYLIIATPYKSQSLAHGRLDDPPWLEATSSLFIGNRRVRVNYHLVDDRSVTDMPPLSWGDSWLRFEDDLQTRVSPRSLSWRAMTEGFHKEILIMELRDEIIRLNELLTLQNLQGQLSSGASGVAP